MVALSLASSPAIGASMMMKPMMVPSRPSFISELLAKPPKPFEPLSRSARPRSSRVLIQATRALRPRFQRRISNMSANEALRQRTLTLHRPVIQKDGIRLGGLDHRRCFALLLAFAGNDEGAPKTMEGRAQVQDGDDGRDVGSVRSDHAAEEPVSATAALPQRRLLR